VQTREKENAVSDVTRQQLCAALAVSESTVRRLELVGLPFTPIGVRGKRYDAAEVKRWLRENGCQSGQTKTVVAMSELWSAANAFTESYRRAHLRVMPKS
jgi:phage terminase Nu1 subunit (DNA packaging protein)